jgi:hypothetical protein
MLILVAVLASLAFIGWLIYRAARRQTFNAHTITYAVAILTGIFTYAFFLSMDLPQLVKILVSILLGAALIFLAAYLQLRRRPRKS